MVRNEGFNEKDSVEILCIGSELLLGNTLNTNSRWIAEELASIGLPHYRQTVVGDNSKRLEKVLIEATTRSHILITTGGLGPTPDDLTTQTLAKTFNIELEEREEILTDIKNKLQNSNDGSFSLNRKQALLPKGSEIIPNPSGTAPGIIWQPIPEFTILTFPGVPSELKIMWKDTAVPWLKSHINFNTVLTSRTLQFAGISESLLAEKVSDLLQKTNPTVAPYASLGEVKLRITAKGDSFSETRNLLTPCEEEIRQRLGLYCYGSDEDSLASVIIDLLRKRKETLSIAESCTGGQLSAALTKIPGASDVFLGGVVAYCNNLKKNLLNVSTKTLEQHGAVSSEVVLEMANGAKKNLESDWAISISGLAGPSGRTQTKPIGTVHIGIVGPEKIEADYQNLFGKHLGREGIQKMSVIRSLDNLRILLLSRS